MTGGPGTLGDLRFEIDGRNIAWKVGELLEARDDNSNLRLVLRNLLSNDVKYPRASRHRNRWHEQGGEVVFYVHDNGVGFDSRYVDKLFGVLQRPHSEEEFEGTGVGLASIWRIVNRCGVRTWAEGRAESGATFYFLLPRPTGRHSDEPE